MGFCKTDLSTGLTKLLLFLILAPTVVCQDSNKPVLNMTKVLEITTVRETVTNFVITCSVPKTPGSNFKFTKSLEISRSLLESRPDESDDYVPDPQSLILAQDSDDRLAKAMAGNINYTAQGQIGGSDGTGLIRLTIRVAGCWDAGMYTCTAGFYTDTARTETSTSESSLALEVNPMEPMLTTDPEMNMWHVDKHVTINCSFNTGTPKTLVQIKWEYRDRFAAVVLWTAYTGNITTSTMKEDCFNRLTSVLTKTLQGDDVSRIYRCYILKGEREDNLAGDAERAAVLTVMMNRDDLTPPGIASAILGIIFGFVTLFAGIGLYLFFRSKRNAKAQKLQSELMKKQQANEERRRSIAAIASKRKSLGTSKGTDYDTILTKLDKKGKGKGKSEASTAASGAGSKALPDELSSIVDKGEESSMASSMASSSAEPESVVENIEKVL